MSWIPLKSVSLVLCVRICLSCSPPRSSDPCERSPFISSISSRLLTLADNKTERKKESELRPAMIRALLGSKREILFFCYLWEWWLPSSYISRGGSFVTQSLSTIKQDRASWIYPATAPRSLLSLKRSSIASRQQTGADPCHILCKKSIFPSLYQKKQHILGHSLNTSEVSDPFFAGLAWPGMICRRLTKSCSFHHSIFSLRLEKQIAHISCFTSQKKWRGW